MNKSFVCKTNYVVVVNWICQVESGGTVLSTNWDEVQKDKVEMKAPDGMEFKKYEI